MTAFTKKGGTSRKKVDASGRKAVSEAMEEVLIGWIHEHSKKFKSFMPSNHEERKAVL